MFTSHFNLREDPFGATPDFRYLYMSCTHREALASLVWSIESGRGFSALIAPPGMGKTTLLFELLQRYERGARTAFVFQTQTKRVDFLRLLVAEFGLPLPQQNDEVRMFEEFNEFLVAEARAGRRVIAVVDEAQNLRQSVLEAVRLLSDFETPREKLLQIIMAGQPALADKMASPALAQLRQRIAITARLDAFGAQDTAAYIQYRLRRAGHSGAPLFTPTALRSIARLSAGIPRNINTLCFNALSIACALGKHTVEDGIIREVAADSGAGTLPSSRRT